MKKNDTPTYQVSVELYSNNVESKSITELLKVDPTIEWKKGEPWSRGRFRQENAWKRYEEGALGEDLHTVLERIDRLFRNKADVLRGLGKECTMLINIIIHIPCSLCASGFTLSHDDLTSIEKYHIPTKFSIYICDNNPK
jgi:hypothetical protein